MRSFASGYSEFNTNGVTSSIKGCLRAFGPRVIRWIRFEIITTETDVEQDDLRQVTGEHFFIRLNSLAGFESKDSGCVDLQTAHIEQYLDQPLPVVLTTITTITKKSTDLLFKNSFGTNSLRRMRANLNRSPFVFEFHGRRN